MPDLLVDAVAILLLIVANGLFSGAEIAVVTARTARLETLALQGSRPAQLALRLARAPNELLATVQIGITLIGVLSGALGGTILAAHLTPLLRAIPGVNSQVAPAVSLALVVGLITYLSLVIGELVPKRMALAAPERIACALAPPMRLLSRLASPLVRLLDCSTGTTLRLLGVPTRTEPAITEDDIKALIRQGAETGVLEAAETEMMQRVFRLGDRPIQAIMTPRTEISWLDASAPIEVSLRQVVTSHHSRFPLGRGSLDACLGVIRGATLLASQLSGDLQDLTALVQEPLYMPESARALQVLEQFRRTGIHIALVSDEFGGIEGLVTLNDLMEAIVGDLPSQQEQEEPLIVQREDGSWLIDGALDIADFRELVGARSRQEEPDGHFHTLGGLILHLLGHIPRAGEQVPWSRWCLEVMDMDGKRVDKVLVSPLQPEQDG